MDPGGTAVPWGGNAAALHFPNCGVPVTSAGTALKVTEKRASVNALGGAAAR